MLSLTLATSISQPQQGEKGYWGEKLHNGQHLRTWHLEQSVDTQQTCQKTGAENSMAPLDGRLGSSHEKAASYG